MVGNGVVNRSYDTVPGQMNMSYVHAIIDDALWDQMTSHQCDYSKVNFDQPPSD